MHVLVVHRERQEYAGPRLELLHWQTQVEMSLNKLCSLKSARRTAELTVNKWSLI